MVTVLCQDVNGGLEIQRRNGEWAAMPPIPGTFVINIGDLLERWSNRRYRSTVHRVIDNLMVGRRGMLSFLQSSQARTATDPE